MHLEVIAKRLEMSSNLVRNPVDVNCTTGLFISLQVGLSALAVAKQLKTKEEVWRKLFSIYFN